MRRPRYGRIIVVKDVVGEGAPAASFGFLPSWGAGFALAERPWLLVPLFAIYGLYIAATDGVGKAYAVDLVPPRLRATSVGILGTVAGIATLVASVVAGILWDRVGPWAPFALGAVGALVSAALFATLPGNRAAASGTAFGRSTS